MTLLWTGNMCVGIKQFDDDHRRLVKYANELWGAIREGEAQGKVSPIEIEIMLHRLMNYARGHCSHEEQLMEKTSFPGLEEHRAEHHRLLAKAEEMAQLYAGSSDLHHAKEIAEFVYNWITQHIHTMDREYSDHLHKHGIF